MNTKLWMMMMTTSEISISLRNHRMNIIIAKAVLIKWLCFDMQKVPNYWPFVWWIYGLPVVSLPRSQVIHSLGTFVAHNNRDTGNIRLP